MLLNADAEKKAFDPKSDLKIRRLSGAAPTGTMRTGICAFLSAKPAATRSASSLLGIVEVADEQKRPVCHMRAAEGVHARHEACRDPRPALELAPRSLAVHRLAVVDRLRGEEALELEERARRRVGRKELVARIGEHHETDSLVRGDEPADHVRDPLELRPGDAGGHVDHDHACLGARREDCGSAAAGRARNEHGAGQGSSESESDREANEGRPLGGERHAGQVAEPGRAGPSERRSSHWPAPSSWCAGTPARSEIASTSSSSGSSGDQASSRVSSERLARRSGARQQRVRAPSAATSRRRAVRPRRRA